MRSEFDRYGLKKFRKTTGILEVAGGIGLLLGLEFQLLLLLASAGLAALMFMGVITRIRIHDKFALLLPALVYFFICVSIFYFSLNPDY